MTQDEIDMMWQQAMRQSIEDGEVYTRYHFAKLVAAKALTQRTEQKPVAWIERDMQCDDFDLDSVTCEKPTIAANGWEWVALYTHPPQRTEPVIDKSAAIHIATSLGWTPPKGNT